VVDAVNAAALSTTAFAAQPQAMQEEAWLIIWFGHTFGFRRSRA
jgi:hypothetical protein